MDNYRRAEHTQRPLTEEERRFAEVHHDLIYRYMNLHKPNPEEWYDILIIPYLDAVKKFHQYERLQNLKFEQIFFRTLDSARSRYWRDMNRKKRCPEGGVWSYDEMFYEVEDGARKECDFEPTDKFMNVERQATIRALYEDFYNKCIDPDMVQADTRQFELNMLLEGYSMTEIAQFLLDKYSSDDFSLQYWAVREDRKEFRKIFKQVFGI